ncbi:MAG TPA: cysteine--tRNA ligase [Bacteroidota bacterium]|nr:cysteine--tRNA ligase [Bacteroidota bacterium]
MPLHIYNSLTRRKEPFEPLHKSFVGMYVCGPTVYSHSHIGHGKSYVSFDVIVRYLRFTGYKVLYVQNITDVGHLLGDTSEGEDRLVRQSKIEQKHPMQIAEEYTHSYFEDMDALNVLRPDISPRASGHIIEQIELIKKLLERGFAYEVGGSVYFDVRKFADYGKLSHRSLDEMVEGTRVEVRSEKRNPQDFALWKKAEPEHIMRWPSPWGEGYPGWHIECSAMSMKYLGESFDIHGGGLDNQFPHHECEIAQSVCATGKPFVKYWLHNNLVTVGGQKMSKSLGNFVTLKDAFKKYDPLVIRFFILQSHYRSTLDFSNEALSGAKAGFDKLVNTIRNVRMALAKAESESRAGILPFDIQLYKKRFIEAMDDDFNTPQAIAVLFDLSKEVNQLLNSDVKAGVEALQSVDATFRELAGEVLGLIPDEKSMTIIADGKLEAGLIQLLIDVRAEARKQKLFALSDMIRDGLKNIGIALEDKKEGTTWKKLS